jgi:phosphoglycerate dehydrogenase-like enzyme
MPNPTIVATAALKPIAVETLKPFGDLVVMPDYSMETLFPHLKNAIAIALRGDGYFPEEALTAAPNVKVLARTGVGYNKVCVAAATKRKIPVVFTPGVGARAVAEGAMAWMLALSKNICRWDAEVKAGNWNSREEMQNDGLEGATLGIIGLGRIGQRLAKMASPCDMTILAYDPFVSADVAKSLGVEMVELDDLMSRSDFISVHAAATDENRGLINRERLAGVKRGAYFLNLARGWLVDNLDDLHEALTDGRLAGAALDVYEPEPPDVSHPLFRHPNFLTAPHAIAGSKYSTNKIHQTMAEGMAAALSGQRPKFVVNPEIYGVD